ncbi:MAG: tetratricopeptide repeat protein [Bacteroidetes bacterium]|nr:tetratricopeptide repeat protein [Bacteroidota bacterium]
MKKNKNLAIFLFFAALVQIYVIYHYYEKGKENDRKEIFVLRSQAFEKLTTGYFDSAVKIYSKILDIDSKDSSAHLFRGLAYQGQKKYDEAIADFNEVLSEDPNKVDAIILLGNLYSEKGDDKKAIEHYLKAEKIEPGNPLVPVYKSAYFLKMKQPDEAITELEKIQKIKPDFESLQAFFGEAYFLKGEMKQAEIYLQNASQMSSATSKTWLMLGSVLQAKGDKKGGCDAFNEANRSNSKTAADSLKKYCE